MASSMDTSLRGLTMALLRRQEVDPSSDPNVGKARNTDSSLSALISTIVPLLIVWAVMIILFLILRRSQRRQYAPRTYLGALRKEERSPDLPKGLFNWVGSFYAIPDTFVLNHSSLDGYLLLRFLKIVVAIGFVGCCITWPVLFPVNATGGGGQTQLNLLSMSNVTDNNRYYAHVFIAWIFYGFVMLMVTREHMFYINLRQAYLLSPLYSSRMSSRTVLFTSVPDEFLNEGKLRRMFGNKLKNLWIATDTKELEDLVKERDKTAMKLEGAEIKLTKLANGARIKAQKSSGGRDEESTTAGHVDGESGSVASRWLKPKQRPTHRTKFLIGKKVDTIDWARSELSSLIPKVDALQNTHRAGEAKFVSSVFIEFYSQAEAQAAYQMVAHHQALHMAPRFIGISPDEVIWQNLRIKWWERIIRNIVTISFVVALVVFWSFPVALVGLISKIDFVAEKVPFLSFIYDIPPIILGVVTGLLPTIMLAILMALLPIILRLAAKWGGLPSLSRIELRTQNFYFAFQVVQVFLVTTLSSAASASVNQIIDDPMSVTDLLAENIPKASTFYLSYFVLQGLIISSGALLQIVGLILSRILGKILDKSPRKMYNRWAKLSGLGWGTVFPVHTMLGVIAITYAIIAPLVLGFATLGMYLIYFAYRYNLLFVFDNNIDTHGLVYPRALQGLTVGIYIGQLCLIGLFGIAAAPGPIALMVVNLVFTILYHISLNSAFGPLLNTLPTSLEAEEEALLSVEDGTYSSNGPMIDSKGIHAMSGKDGHRDISSSSTGPTHKDLPAVPQKKPSFFMKWLRPDKFHDYHTLRRLVPRSFADIVYTPETERDAYYNPAVKSLTPLLWIPRDSAGVSRQEVKHTSRVIPITDEGAQFDEKNKVIWNAEETGGRPPIWEPKTYY